MPEAIPLISGEFSCKLGQRFRLTLPGEFKDVFKPESGKCVIAKQQTGCLSLWDKETWQSHHDARIGLVQERLRLGYLGQKMAELQVFGRLLSTRHKEINLEGRARLVLPEGFREFLGVEEGQEVMVVGAAVCIEIWHPGKFFNYVEGEIPEFNNLLETLLH